MEGVEVIGWDPAEKVYRSWVFDSQGGFGSAVWTEGEGDKWIRRLTGTPGPDRRRTPPTPSPRSTTTPINSARTAASWTANCCPASTPSPLCASSKESDMMRRTTTWMTLAALLLFRAWHAHHRLGCARNARRRSRCRGERPPRGPAPRDRRRGPAPPRRPRRRAARASHRSATRPVGSGVGARPQHRLPDPQPFDQPHRPGAGTREPGAGPRGRPPAAGDHPATPRQAAPASFRAGTVAERHAAVRARNQAAFARQAPARTAAAARPAHSRSAGRPIRQVVHPRLGRVFSNNWWNARRNYWNARRHYLNRYRWWWWGLVRLAGGRNLAGR